MLGKQSQVTDGKESTTTDLWHVNGYFVGKKLSQMFCRLWDLLTPVMQSSKTILRK